MCALQLPPDSQLVTTFVHSGCLPCRLQVSLTCLDEVQGIGRLEAKHFCQLGCPLLHDCCISLGLLHAISPCRKQPFWYPIHLAQLLKDSPGELWPVRQLLMSQGSSQRQEPGITVNLSRRQISSRSEHPGLHIKVPWQMLKQTQANSCYG